MSVDQSFNACFSKRDTQIAKGIAILCMLFHHTYPNVCYQPLFLLEDKTILSIIAASGTLCFFTSVALEFIKGKTGYKAMVSNFRYRIEGCRK